MNKQRYISVPKDYEAMQALEYGIEKPNQTTEWRLQEKELTAI